MKSFYEKSFWLKSVLVVLIAVTALMAFFPFNPAYAGGDIDSSWGAALNQALAQGLQFGKEFIFTYGPFGSILTQIYHPDTFALIQELSLVFSLFLLVTLLIIARGQKIAGMLLYLLGMWIFTNYNKDTLFFSYPLLTALAVYQFTKSPLLASRFRQTCLRISLASIFIPLGLLPLVKVSFLFPSLVILITNCIWLWSRSEKKMAMVIAVIPGIALLVFWHVAHQNFNTLADYFVNSSFIVGGYSEAMAYSGNILQIFLYLFGALCLIAILLTSKDLNNKSKLFFIICYGCFLFVVFKGAFVRHDSGHIFVAPCSLITAFFSLLFIIPLRRFLLIGIGTALVIWCFFIRSYMGLSSIHPLTRIAEQSFSMLEGIHKLIFTPNYFEDTYNTRLASTYNQAQALHFTGSSDIYSYNQSYLFAAKDLWSPRPVFQSYSAYTPELERLNAKHLLSSRAPDNIFFNIQAINERLPALEDGLSWIIILQNYQFQKFINEYAYFTHHINKSSLFKNLQPLSSNSYHLGDKVELSDKSSLLFAEIDVRPSLLGKLTGVLFKLPSLEIAMTLRDGRTITYLFIPGMAQAGFLLSPLISNTTEFTQLTSTKTLSKLAQNQVQSFVIQSPHDKLGFWKKSYTLRLQQFIN